MIKVSIENDDLMLAAATARYICEYAVAHGLDPELKANLQAAIESGCRNVIKHAYEPGEPVRYQLEVTAAPGTLVVAVQDQGLPFDAAQLNPRIRGLVHEVRLLSSGREGKRLELVVNLERPEAQHPLSPAEQAPLPPAADEQVTIRPATAEDAIPIARCVYRCYGSSYGSDYLYRPKKLRGLWEAGLVTSVVAVNPDNEVIGHLCYWVDAAADRAGESTDAIVDPRYRGRHLFDRLKAALVEETRAQGRLGMISEAVTVHPYSQKGVIASGAVETGLMLGDLPSNLKFKGIESQLPARQSCMLCYLRLNPEPLRAVYLPERHAPILRKIYEKVGLAREFPGSVPASPLRGEASLEVKMDEGWGEAALRVVNYGPDLESLLRAQLRHLLANGVPYLYAELPLTDPSIGLAVETLESMGFSFAGLVPELCQQGDILRLHYLANVELDLKIEVVTEWGAEIRDYVLAQAGPGLAPASP